jgi:hypothetical protein
VKTTKPAPPVQVRIGDLVEAPPVQTVIRLDEAHRNPRQIAETFVFTNDITAHLTILTDVLRLPTGKGMFLQGDFGSGKSHFLAAVTAWLASGEGTEKLTDAHEGFTAIRRSGRRLLPVDVSLVRFRAATPLERIIASAIENQLAAMGVAVTLSPLSLFFDRFKTILREPAMAAEFAIACPGAKSDIDAWFHANQRDAYLNCVKFLKQQGVNIPELLVEERHEVFRRALEAVRGAGFSGMVLILDELSEFFRSKADPAQLNEDARTLQFLGELAGTEPLWIIAAVQESIERTGDIAQATFRKIKDRFPIKFHLSTLHIRELIGRRLVRRKDGAEQHIYRIHQDYQRHFPGFACAWDLFRAIYPVHPATLGLLEGLGDLFSQHRGIVDFVHARIAGDPQRQIEGILSRPAAELLAPDSIYEHFSPRLLEFSAFHVYPKHIIPHLDEVIGKVIDDGEDQRLARRLVRILVLYALHPTVKAPGVQALAELGACMLSAHDQTASPRFIAGLLDPVVEHSRFLTKEIPAGADALGAVYTITVHDDHTKALRGRIRRVMADIAVSDSRLIMEPLAQVQASPSWPGPELLAAPVERQATWRLSSRQAVVVFVNSGAEAPAVERLRAFFAEGGADLGLAIVLGDTRLDCEHTAVWRVPAPGPEAEVLREYLATKLVRAEMRATNPADAPLIPLIDESFRTVSQAAQQAVVNLIYTGGFDGKEIAIDPAALQMKRIDRLLETAAEYICEQRYPKFKEIASRLLPPSPRTYQRLYEELVTPGSLSMIQARKDGLTQAIESIVAPLGLVEVRSGSYRVAPELAEHPFLAYVFGLLRSSGPTPMAEVMRHLRFGAYGMPQDMAEFVICSLAHCGLVALLNHGRTVPLEFMKLSSAESADAIAPGELISRAYREMLQNSCASLLTDGATGSFGLRQQRDAWQAVVKLRKTLEPMLNEATARISNAAGYSAFESFDMERIKTTITALRKVIEEIKVSYSAREGLERFLDTWRSQNVSDGDIDFIKNTNLFFQNSAEHFIFITHYLRNRSVEYAVEEDTAVSRCHEAVMNFLRDPQTLVVNDRCQGLDAAFGEFREYYATCYSVRHDRFYAALARPAISKQRQRVLAVLRGLAGIECLDRPPGCEALLREIDKPQRPACRRNIMEELLRAPMCSCGFMIDDAPPLPTGIDWEQAIAESLEQYAGILATPAVAEALTARAYAVRDMQPALAVQLQKLTSALKSGAEGGALIDLLDPQTLREIGLALSGNTTVEARPVGTLLAGLAGRRLTPRKIRELVEAWIARAGEETLIAIDGSEAPAAEGRKPFVGWWPLLRPDLFGDLAEGATPGEAQAMERALEESIDVASVRTRLAGLDNARLAGFVAEEPVFTRALRAGWELLVERVLDRSIGAEAISARSRHQQPAVANACVKRLEELRQCAALLTASFPDRLQARIHCAALIYDDWANEKLQALATAAIETIAAAGNDWLATLPAVSAADLSRAPLICVIDGVAPDVWLKCRHLLPALNGVAVSRWERLNESAQTIPSLNNLLGFPQSADPIEMCAIRGITYEQVDGNAPQTVMNLIAPPQPGVPTLVRIARIDRGGHDGSMRLYDMPAALARILTDDLPGMLDVCRQQKRPFVLTSDHGLSLARKRLTHGEGGVFEKAVFRTEWNP